MELNLRQLERNLYDIVSGAFCLDCVLRTYMSYKTAEQYTEKTGMHCFRILLKLII
jgi:hypothetical protein